MSTTPESFPPIKVFISYSRKDKRLKDELTVHFSSMKRRGLIEDWQDRDIEAGAVWEEKLLGQLNESKLILCLISPDFINSDYCYDIETKLAFKMKEDGKAEVIPILLKPAAWKKTIFSKIQAIPRDGKYIALAPAPKRAALFVDVAKEIERVVEILRAKNNENFL